LNSDSLIANLEAAGLIIRALTFSVTAVRVFTIVTHVRLAQQQTFYEDANQKPYLPA
jgi:hypothetical protein